MAALYLRRFSPPSVLHGAPPCGATSCTCCEARRRSHFRCHPPKKHSCLLTRNGGSFLRAGWQEPRATPPSLVASVAGVPGGGVVRAGHAVNGFVLRGPACNHGGQQARPIASAEKLERGPPSRAALSCSARRHETAWVTQARPIRGRAQPRAANPNGATRVRPEAPSLLSQAGPLGPKNTHPALSIPSASLLLRVVWRTRLARLARAGWCPPDLPPPLARPCGRAALGGSKQGSGEVR